VNSSWLVWSQQSCAGSLNKVRTPSVLNGHTLMGCYLTDPEKYLCRHFPGFLWCAPSTATLEPGKPKKLHKNIFSVPWFQGCSGRRTPKKTGEMSTQIFFGICKVAPHQCMTVQDTRRPNFVERPFLAIPKKLHKNTCSCVR
jgi:hypothetical protein